MHSSYRPETTFDKTAAVDLDLSPFDPKSNPNLPVHPDNMSTKFNQNPKRCTRVIVRKTLLTKRLLVTLTFDLLTQKAIPTFLSILTICQPSLIKIQKR